MRTIATATATKAAKPTLENTTLTEHFWRTKLPTELRTNLVAATGKSAVIGKTAREVFDTLRTSTTAVTSKEAKATATQLKKFITTGEL